MIQIPSHIPEKKKKEKSIFDRSSVLCLWSFNLNAESNIQSRYEYICLHFCLCIDIDHLRTSALCSFMLADSILN